ncbi:sensor histidine kinase [Rugosimonospora africana]|uniref:Signal transduction histidine-protein kinase/phosphatase MprB n=1 Tax=Rugosimonospora africana TaxID=556532 RepID=A0A8J3QPN1_9ACTN|nr:HAMP domain-containing sensor histidine kinase [Rugosimonospora africana]GIH13148.1 two-component sensor histidine kinase [Rugosimonospora africana]
MRNLLRTLTARAVLAGCLVALVSVIVTALVAIPLAVRAANRAERSGLANQTEIVAAAIDLRPGSAANLVRDLHAQNIDVYVVRAGRPDRTALPARFVTAVTSGRPVSGTALVGGKRVMVEGRPLPGTGNGVILTQRAGTRTAPEVLQRLYLALVAGLVAGALAGALLARRLARPIRHAAGAAARLSAGDRSVRVEPEPPIEVEELAHALNELGSALSTSESRQREFLLSISHELRTPLTTLKGYAEALSDGVIGPDGVARTGQLMLTEAEHLDRLVSDLLALARLDAVDFPLSVLPVDLTALVDEAAQAWAGRCAGVGVVLRTDLPHGPVPVPTDPGRIRQVIDGLMENALRVVPPGAPVVLAVYPPVPPGFAIIEVRDGGPGFTDADLAVAFQRGALHERYRGVRKVGSGLGLALAAGLVRRLGGTIEAGHAPEGGARFTVRLPVYQTRTSR